MWPKPKFFSIALFALAPTITFAAVERAKSINNTQNLTVEDAQSIGIERNLQLKSAKLNLENAKINYDNAWDIMYMPSVNLSLNSTSEKTIGTVPGTPAAAAAQGSPLGVSRNYPNSNAAISLGDYNLFNFFRDQIAYDIAKISYERAEQQYQEQVRSIRFQIIKAYFRAKTELEKYDAAKRSVDLSSTILNLMKSRLKLNTATQDEVSSSEVDVLNAKTQLAGQDQTSYDALANLNLLLNTNVQQKFNLISTIQYEALRIGAEEAFQVFKKTGPQIRDSTVFLKNSEMALELAEKNRLPLPTIKLAGMSVGYQHNYTGGTSSLSTNGSSAPGGQLNVQAVVALTIPLYGPGGFLGSRTLSQARISRDLSEVTYTQTSINGELGVRVLVQQILREQNQLEVLKEAFEASLKILQGTFKKMSSGKANRLELRDAIAQARNSEIAYLELVVQHLSDKLSLAELIGVDQLPNEVKP